MVYNQHNHARYGSAFTLARTQNLDSLCQLIVIGDQNSVFFLQKFVLFDRELSFAFGMGVVRTPLDSHLVARNNNKKIILECPWPCNAVWQLVTRA